MEQNRHGSSTYARLRISLPFFYKALLHMAVISIHSWRLANVRPRKGAKPEPENREIFGATPGCQSAHLRMQISGHWSGENHRGNSHVFPSPWSWVFLWPKILISKNHLLFQGTFSGFPLLLFVGFLFPAILDFHIYSQAHHHTSTKATNPYIHGNLRVPLNKPLPQKAPH